MFLCIKSNWHFSHLFKHCVFSAWSALCNLLQRGTSPPTVNVNTEHCWDDGVDCQGLRLISYKLTSTQFYISAQKKYRHWRMGSVWRASCSWRRWCVTLVVDTMCDLHYSVVNMWLAIQCEDYVTYTSLFGSWDYAQLMSDGSCYVFLFVIIKLTCSLCLLSLCCCLFVTHANVSITLPAHILLLYQCTWLLT